jgi:hypothetical protein
MQSEEIMAVWRFRHIDYLQKATADRCYVTVKPSVSQQSQKINK